MNFRRGRTREEPEINFIPLIDLMLVILIFLMATTTYSKFAELKINLPSADAEKTAQRASEIQVAVTSGGRYAINGQLVNFTTIDDLADSLRKASSSADSTIVVNADGGASHQAVVNVMEAARQAGLGRLTFATQTATSH
ncbi:ExbD/TolR family protein [Parachitinimonas caeni]|uniref:Biopolymer transporter ExbD n=1 Tax=Parachitinimonas caeni TaxID=3031301 RepID=A0ABT7DU18_9NEIS|nr:biopolymer transporter ExbD [Parachitinimonas caeni]MDK2123561.1 biopolymer transporter ExbD [Parachitinimonas caeni]